MITAQQFYYLECDEDPCLERFPALDDETVAWADPVILLEQAKENDWLAWSGKHFCPDHVCFCVECEQEIVPSKIKICDECRKELFSSEDADDGRDLIIAESQPQKGHQHG